MRSFLSFFVLFLVVNASTAYAGPEEPPVHVWAFTGKDWCVGAVIYPNDTYVSLGTFHHRVSVAAQTMERVAIYSALACGALIALFGFHCIRRKSIQG